MNPSEKECRALFLSYHSENRETVSQISRLLKARGLSTFLDRSDLVPGLPWPDALEKALAGARAVAVFLGRDGLGTWQKREMWYALDRQVQAEKAGTSFPVIPVLLPGSDPTAGFLFLNTWIDLRNDPGDPLMIESLAQAVFTGARVQCGEPHLCPYRGLEPFDEEDAAFFCGRDAFSDRLLAKALASPFVAVIGPSGSGKSSIVRAGLVPRLRRQRPPAPAWDAVFFTPGERPWHRLAAALLLLLEPDLGEVDRLLETEKLGDHLAGGSIRLEDTLRRVLAKSRGTGRLLVVADQFEELFTLTADPVRRPLIEALLTVTEKLPVTLVLTLRADFYDRALTLSRELSDRFERAQVNLGPMRREDLTRAVLDPAGRVGLAFEPGLVDRILDDVGEEPGNLPLLEFALTELWMGRSGRRLTNEAYAEIGGVIGAIAQRAEAELGRLSTDQQRTARRVFTRLVRVARLEDGSRDTRQRASLHDFDEAAREMVDHLAGRENRLLVIGRDEKGESIVEVTHEALIKGWERLRQWLDEDREFLLWGERLRGHLTEHERSGALLSGAPLVEAGRWLEEQREDLSDQEAAFIEASIKARESALAAEARRKRRLTLAGLVTAGVLAILGATTGWLGWRAKQQAEEARAGSILAAQEAITDPSIAALLDLEIDQLPIPRLKGSLEGIRVLRDAALSVLPATIFHEHEDTIWDVAFSPDGSRIATASSDGTARIWNADGSGRPHVLRGRADQESVAFSPDGSSLLTASEDGTVRVWSIEDFRKPPTTYSFGQGKNYTLDAVFSPSGAHIIAFEGDIAKVWSTNGSGEPRVFQGKGVWVSPDGSRILTETADSKARIWRVDERSEPITLPVPVLEATFTPDGARVAISSSDTTIHVWKTDGSDKPVVFHGKVGSFFRVALSPDGLHLVTASDRCTVLIWSIALPGAAPIALDHPKCFGVKAAFSPDGSRIVTVADEGAEGVVRLWNADGSGEPMVLLGQKAWAVYTAFSPDGSRIATTSQDGAVRIWNTAGPAEPRVLSGHTGRVLSTAFSPDGALVATTSTDKTARVWKTQGFDKSSVFRGHTEAVISAAFNGDGSRVVTASLDGTARIWKADGSGTAIVLPIRQTSLRDAAFSPDGSHVLTLTFDGIVQVWNADGSGPPVVLRAHRGGLLSAEFSPDGTRFVTASEDRTARVWKTNGTGKPVILRHTDEVLVATFSPEGSRILTASADHNARIWNTDGTGKPIVLRGHTGLVLCASFSRDGTQIVTGSSDLTARVWSVRAPTESVVLGGHDSEGWIVDAAFSPDGSRVLTRSSQRVARLWNADGSGDPIVLDGQASEADFSPDGSRVVTASEDGTARIWRVSWPALIDDLKTSIRACLTENQRKQYLGESRSDAHQAFMTCQRKLSGR